MLGTCGNPAITFLIKKRIITELFIDRTAALYIGETRIRVVTDEGDQPGSQADRRKEYTLRIIVMLTLKVWERKIGLNEFKRG